MIGSDIEYADLVTLLIENGADPEVKGRFWLHTAATKKWAKTCSALIKKANVNSKTGKDETALHKACATGDSATILAILEAKPENIKDYQGNPAHVLLPFDKEEDIKKNYDSVIKKFKDNGFDLSEESPMERSSIGLLSKASHKHGALKNMEYLIKECGLPASGGKACKKPPLFNAASNGDLELIEFLLDNGADANAVVHGVGYSEGVSSLSAAILSKSFADKGGKAKAVARLIKSGAKPNDHDKEVAKDDADILALLN